MTNNYADWKNPFRGIARYNRNDKISGGSDIYARTGTNCRFLYITVFDYRLGREHEETPKKRKKKSLS